MFWNVDIISKLALPLPPLGQQKDWTQVIMRGKLSVKIINCFRSCDKIQRIKIQRIKRYFYCLKPLKELVIVIF
jgi:hypothetical protein